HDTSLHLWNPYSDEKHIPFRTFQCHTNVLPGFSWRICNIDDRNEYQLVSWSDDSHLKLWTIDSSSISVNNHKNPTNDENLSSNEKPKLTSLESESQLSSRDNNVKLNTSKEDRIPSP